MGQINLESGDHNSIRTLADSFLQLVTLGSLDYINKKQIPLTTDYISKEQE